EGKIARANRGRDPLYLFSALQRQLGYPEVPRPRRPDEAEARIALLEQRVNTLENRIKALETGAAGEPEINLDQLRVKPEDTDGLGRAAGTWAWYETPTCKKRIVSTPKDTPGIISSATADLAGDGKAEIAIAYEFAMNEPTKGKLLLAIQGKSPDDPWTLKPV